MISHRALDGAAGVLWPWLGLTALHGHQSPSSVLPSELAYREAEQIPVAAKLVIN